MTTASTRRPCRPRGGAPEALPAVQPGSTCPSHRARGRKTVPVHSGRPGEEGRYEHWVLEPAWTCGRLPMSIRARGPGRKPCTLRRLAVGRPPGPAFGARSGAALGLLSDAAGSHQDKHRLDDPLPWRGRACCGPDLRPSENLREARITFLTFSGRLPVRISLLLVAWAGALATFATGSARTSAAPRAAGLGPGVSSPQTTTGSLNDLQPSAVSDMIRERRSSRRRVLGRVGTASGGRRC